MSIQLKEENGGTVLVINISGKLQATDYDQFVPDLERLASKHGKLRLLFNVTDFPGWKVGALWDDTPFADKRFTDIAKLALVGDSACQSGMAVFCKPFTRATIRYFDRGDTERVREWLDR